MSALLYIVISIAIVVAVFLLLAAVTKSEYTVTRSVVIDQPKQVVFDYIKYLKNQDNYSVWVMMDPGMKKEYTGTDGTVGFKSSWNSDNKKVGQGEQTITGINEGEMLNSEIHFIKPFEGLAKASMITDALPLNKTKVTWTFTSKMAYPMNIMLLFMNMDKMIGGDLETGLVNLKNVLEA
ncbi:SRPBCC family protein [Mucilaginibacter jinjuensis]|uniref:SRPBCC family protein n=1 Tax=Mucilaginibacter jinjuensis TaxID=1176721 RepID=A0ABY7T8I8_9SPHI|nr:SRPBCC family protein [Mucilaginibacter jinjuensis]WCT12677.1 SRPBCC family protein [Mucilaginibacter jinjuensis]